MAVWRQNSIAPGHLPGPPVVGDRVGRGPGRPHHRRYRSQIREQQMAKAYYSTVFEQPAQKIWEIVRDFNNYPVWVGGAGESAIEDGKSGDTVGAIRNVLYQERRIRQRLLAQSDVERSQTYEFCGAPAMPMIDYQATLRVTPVTDGER